MIHSIHYHVAQPFCYFEFVFELEKILKQIQNDKNKKEDFEMAKKRAKWPKLGTINEDDVRQLYFIQNPGEVCERCANSDPESFRFDEYNIRCPCGFSKKHNIETDLHIFQGPLDSKARDE